MTDITTVWDVQRAQGDWVVSGGALRGDNDLATAVLISLFTDGLADASDTLPDKSGDRRGWWGDQGQTVNIGSKLWLLSREKLLPSVATRAQKYATDALQWMVSDGVAGSVAASAAIIQPNQLRLAVTVVRPNGSSTSYAFDWAWEQLA